MTYIVMRDRQMNLTPVYWNAVLQTSPLMKFIYGQSLGTEVNIFFNGRMNSVMIKEEWDYVGEFISDKMIKDSKYFNNLKKNTEKAKKEIISFLKRADKVNYSTFPLNKLIIEAENIQNLFMIYDAASVPAWFIAGDILNKKIERKLKISQEDFNIITLPSEKTQTTQMEIDILSATKSKDCEKEAEKLTKKYYWVPFGYDGPTVWDKHYFIDKIKEHKCEEANKQLIKIKENDDVLAKKVREIRKRLTEDNNRLVEIVNQITIWTDDRKMLEFQLFYKYNLILEELSKRFKIPLKNLKFLFTDELKNLEKSKENLTNISNYRINNEFYIIVNKGKTRIATEKEIKEIKSNLNNRADNLTLSGNVACKGKNQIYTAIARIILHPNECPKLNEGEFLVATMTSPDFVPAMKKALGFITDEGGVTCHAAIVARELNKPCIIGTKIASKVIKDGDLIEVDANKGIIRILKRA